MDPSGSSSPYLVWQIISIFFLLLLSAFFSSAETTLSTIGKLKIKEMMEKREDRFAGIEDYFAKQKQYLTTILIMNNIVNIVASSLTTITLVSIFPGDSGRVVAISSGLMTLLILTFGEITPKVYARENAEKLFKFSYHIINVLNIILTPVVWVFINISNVFIKIFGGKTIVSAPFITEDEILGYLDLGHEEGVIEKHEKLLMQRSLEMREISVKEVMSPRIDIVALEDTQTIKNLIELINDEGYSRIPVYRDSLDSIVGICYAKDVFKILNQNDSYEKVKNLPVTQIMHKPYFVPMTMKVKDVLKMILANRVHMSIVVDEYGGTAGLVTLEDVLEELTGEIMDEYDDVKEETQFFRIDDSTLLCKGTTPINDLEREFDKEFPETEYETLSGFVLEKFERFPTPGEKLSVDDFEFEVVAVSMNRIEKVKVHCTVHDEKTAGSDDDDL